MGGREGRSEATTYLAGRDTTSTKGGRKGKSGEGKRKEWCDAYSMGGRRPGTTYKAGDTMRTAGGREGGMKETEEDKEREGKGEG